ncbi:hypothetical protein D3C73_1380770 [compost metagenome]
MALNHFSLPHIENLYAHPALVHSIAEHIAVLRVCRVDVLLLHQSLDVDDLVPKFLRPLEIQLLGRLLHLLLKILLHRLMTASKEC